MIKAVIFDLDGVIVSTDEFHYKAWKYMADQENISFDHSINHRLRGVSRMESLNIILEKSKKPYTESEKVSLAKIKNDYYVESLRKLDETFILPGVLEVLSDLKQMSIKVAIGSSSKNTKLILKQIKLIGSFDAIADGNDVKNSKPAPDIFLTAATKLKMNNQDCLVIEDAEAGIIAAKRAGMFAFAVGDAKKSPEADYKATIIKELIDVIKNN